jgi:hypothetical protein
MLRPSLFAGPGSRWGVHTGDGVRRDSSSLTRAARAVFGGLVGGRQ